MTDADAVRAWLRLTLTAALTPAKRRRLLQALGPPEHFLEDGPTAAAEVAGDAARALYAGDPERDAAIERCMQWLGESADRHLWSLADPDYPQALLNLSDPPLVVYAQGRRDAFTRPGVALVGSRNCTPGGASIARGFARSLAEQGWCVVSGLALGIDAAAHAGAIEGGGQTIAVVGTGLDRVYPARNRDLAHAVRHAGALLSEFPLGTGVMPHHFPQRNRLIAALARGVVVVEAAAESGSLITARLAGELGREVFAVPGSIHSPQSRGCHRLLREGAKLVETVRDIVEEIEEIGRPTGTAAASAEAPETPAPHHELLGLAGFDPIDLDTLVARSGLTTGAVLAILSELELDGRVAAVPGGRFQRLG